MSDGEAARNDRPLGNSETREQSAAISRPMNTMQPPGACAVTPTDALMQ